MNPASRVYNFIDKLKKSNKMNEKINQIYYEILEVDNPYDLYKKLHLLSQEVNKLKQVLKSSNQHEEFKDLTANLDILVTPMNLNANLNAVQASINVVHPQLKVFAAALETAQLAEQDVKEDLADLQKELDSFFQKIKDMDIDNETKMLYAKVTYKLKESIDIYEISGIDAVRDHMRVFECITKDEKDAEPINSRFSTIINNASATAGLIGFATGSNLPQLMNIIG